MYERNTSTTAAFGSSPTSGGSLGASTIGPIEAQLNRLSDLGAGLHEIVERLERNLIPVLAPSIPDAAADQALPVQVCPLHGTLTSLCSVVEKALIRLHGMNERIRS